jgi:hypothetical protein
LTHRDFSIIEALVLLRREQRKFGKKTMFFTLFFSNIYSVDSRHSKS